MLNYCPRLDLGLALRSPESHTHTLTTHIHTCSYLSSSRRYARTTRTNREGLAQGWCSTEVHLNQAEGAGRENLSLDSVRGGTRHRGRKHTLLLDRMAESFGTTWDQIGKTEQNRNNIGTHSEQNRNRIGTTLYQSRNTIGTTWRRRRDTSRRRRGASRDTRAGDRFTLPKVSTEVLNDNAGRKSKPLVETFITGTHSEVHEV